MTTESTGADTIGRKEQTPRTSSIAQWTCIGMLLAVFTGGLGFVYKLVQFSKEAIGAEATSFAAIPVITYSCVALGFVSMFLWSLSRGQFRDVEKPKHRMLRREELYERRNIR
jgi:cbb3-type cytochrome oxidase maturation protein